MNVTELVERNGGLASRSALLAATSRREVDGALARGTLVRVGRGRYAAPSVGQAASLAHAVHGVLSLTSAALHHGWEVKQAPARPHVLVPTHRKVPARWLGRLQMHRGDLHLDDISDGIATSRELTLLQCLRSLPEDEGLAVADSALRNGEQATLARVLAGVRGRGRARVQRVGRAADGAAANPFESVLRAICLEVPGLHVQPQVVISSETCWACPDLVDRERHLVIEADSYEWHGHRAGFRKDVRRYTLLVADGWTVLRFTWEDVMTRPGWVREILCRVVEAQDARPAQASSSPG